MADSKKTSRPTSMSTTSYETALCVIPASSHCNHIEQLRELYDKAYESWPPHINLIYPFVAPENLPRAQEQIEQYINDQPQSSPHIIVKLGQAGLFKQRKNSTVYLSEGSSSAVSQLASIRLLALRALGHAAHGANLHLTIGQAEGDTLSSQQFLLSKVRLLPAPIFRVDTLAILLREQMPGTKTLTRMRLWGTVNLSSTGEPWKPALSEFWIREPTSESFSPSDEASDRSELVHTGSMKIQRDVQHGSAFLHSPDSDSWLPCTGTEGSDIDTDIITVASYNVLVDSEYPPERDRDPLLVRTILSDAAMASILVLQEVSDDFLTYMLSDSEIQRRYPFVSHAPPSQPDIAPLPSLRNIVILSCWPFSSKSIPFHRRHKGALIAHFKGIMGFRTSGSGDLVVAGVHLTSGLTDGSVAAKKTQLKNLTSHLTLNHPEGSWVVAGDFNLPTSTYTINTALRNNAISNQTAATLSSIESVISDSGFLDAWSVSRIEANDDLSGPQADDSFAGEEGATFDPRNNMHAAQSSGTSENRPQRYDRILYRPRQAVRIRHFNQFGVPEDIDGVQVVGSDHSGVRASIQILEAATEKIGSRLPTILESAVEHKRTSEVLSNIGGMNEALATHHMIPTQEEAQKRQKAFTLLKEIVTNTSGDEDSTKTDVPMALVAVGSYALNVWTSESDIDCLCIGTISSKTFFKLARQRITQAEGQGIRILRRVEAGTGTMLELSVNGIAMDLQYCSAGKIIERWSDFHNLPASDPAFNLSVLSLRKLKAYRDLLYIQRSLPSLATYRLAYRFIKLWATQRGLYSSKFGYLGGVHITLMLAWVHKRMTYDLGSVNAGDLLHSFFHHYAHFPWASSMVYDAFFHQNKPRYQRSAREPMVVLGFHVPNSNIAHTSTVPGLDILVKEFEAADALLSTPGMTWAEFFGPPDDTMSTTRLPAGVTWFLHRHQSFIKIDIQFWGRTLAKGKSLVGWVESRCLSLVVDINKILPKLNLQVWPARFNDSQPNDASKISEYQGCYLIGLSRTDKGVSNADQEERHVARQSLEKVLNRFLTQLKADERNYDSGTCWIDVSLAKPSEVKDFRLDDRAWGDYEMEPDSEDDEDDLEELNDAPVQRTIAQRPKPTTTPVSVFKLRPASDVLNRLRWDPSLNPSDYIIGYEDRFLGAKEVNLEKWKTEQTDEEFIPQHRILYFKRRGGDDGKGELVWERATRTDTVFGSGAGAAALG